MFLAVVLTAACSSMDEKESKPPGLVTSDATELMATLSSSAPLPQLMYPIVECRLGILAAAGSGMRSRGVGPAMECLRDLLAFLCSLGTNCQTSAALTIWCSLGPILMGVDWLRFRPGRCSSNASTASLSSSSSSSESNSDPISAVCRRVIFLFGRGMFVMAKWSIVSCVQSSSRRSTGMLLLLLRVLLRGMLR